MPNDSDDTPATTTVKAAEWPSHVGKRDAHRKPVCIAEIPFAYHSGGSS